jgi:hypothetical protein
MASLKDLQSRALRELVGTRSMGTASINLQDGTATYDVVGEPDGLVLLSIAGAAKTVATGADKALATVAALQNPITGYDAYYDQPINTTVYYVCCCNAAGDFKVIQGTYEDQVLGGSLARGPRGTGDIPDIVVPDTYAPIAVFKVVNGATAVFVPGTTNWNATNVVAYAAPVCVLPKSAADLTFTEGGA